MITKAVACDLVAKACGFAVWPGKSVAPLKKELFADAKTARVFRPLAVDMLTQKIKRDIVVAAVKSLVPQAENYDHSRRGRDFCEICDIGEIFSVFFGVVALKAV